MSAAAAEGLGRTLLRQNSYPPPDNLYYPNAAFALPYFQYQPHLIAGDPYQVHPLPLQSLPRQHLYFQRLPHYALRQPQPLNHHPQQLSVSLQNGIDKVEGISTARTPSFGWREEEDQVAAVVSTRRRSSSAQPQGSGSSRMMRQPAAMHQGQHPHHYQQQQQQQQQQHQQHQQHQYSAVDAVMRRRQSAGEDRVLGVNRKAPPQMPGNHTSELLDQQQQLKMQQQQLQQQQQQQQHQQAQMMQKQQQQQAMLQQYHTHDFQHGIQHKYGSEAVTIFAMRVRSL